MTELRAGDALLVVDIQNDFCPGGALGVAGGDEIVEPLATLAQRFAARGLPVIASRDWHPPDHVSFRAQGGPWPEHCVRDTPGAAFHPDLELPDAAIIVSKGTDAGREAYSAFEGTGLDAILHDLDVRRILIGGLTTDYCVRESVRDALAKGFDVVWIEDASRAVDAQAGDGDRAAAEILERGAGRVRVRDIRS